MGLDTEQNTSGGRRDKALDSSPMYNPFSQFVEPKLWAPECSPGLFPPLLGSLSPGPPHLHPCPPPLPPPALCPLAFRGSHCPASPCALKDTFQWHGAPPPTTLSVDPGAPRFTNKKGPFVLSSWPPREGGIWQSREGSPAPAWRFQFPALSLLSTHPVKEPRRRSQVVFAVSPL